MSALDASLHTSRLPPHAAGAGGTPTLILVDGAGVVEDSWVGQLAAPEESEVLRQLTGGSPGGESPG